MVDGFMLLAQFRHQTNHFILFFLLLPLVICLNPTEPKWLKCYFLPNDCELAK